MYPAHKAKGDGGRRGDPRRGAGVGPRATLPVEAAAHKATAARAGRNERGGGDARERGGRGCGVRGEEGDGAAGGGGRRRIRAAWAMCETAERVPVID